jgi:thiamine biosynthesis lipoprotein
MKQTRIIWDMPITIEITDQPVNRNTFEHIFTYFKHIDSVFNIFNDSSEMSRINRGEIRKIKWSSEVKEVLALCEKTREETNGYFEHERNGTIDPLGIVKGWAVKKAADKLREIGFKNFYIEAGGDIQVHGRNINRQLWTVGIRNPFNRFENVKVLSLTGCGIATSGNYIRGNHIHNPFQMEKPVPEVVSLTVIGPDVCEADRFATAAFAMGKKGIYFIEKLPGFEGYMIDQKGIATYTSGFEKYIQQNNLSDNFTSISL